MDVCSMYFPPYQYNKGIGSSYKPSRKGHDRSIMNESNETCYKQLAAILSKENDAEY